MRIVWSDDRHQSKCRLYTITRFPDMGSWWEARPPEAYADDRIRCNICGRTWSM